MAMEESARLERERVERVEMERREQEERQEMDTTPAAETERVREASPRMPPMESATPQPEATPLRDERQSPEATPYRAGQEGSYYEQPPQETPHNYHQSPNRTPGC